MLGLGFAQALLGSEHLLGAYQACAFEAEPPRGSPHDHADPGGIRGTVDGGGSHLAPALATPTATLLATTAAATANYYCCRCCYYCCYCYCEYWCYYYYYYFFCYYCTAAIATTAIAAATTYYHLLAPTRTITSAMTLPARVRAFGRSVAP